MKPNYYQHYLFVLSKEEEERRNYHVTIGTLQSINNNCINLNVLLSIGKLWKLASPSFPSFFLKCIRTRPLADNVKSFLHSHSTNDDYDHRHNHYALKQRIMLFRMDGITTNFITQYWGELDFRIERLIGNETFRFDLVQSI